MKTLKQFQLNLLATPVLIGLCTISGGAFSAEGKREGVLTTVTLSPTHSVDFVEFEPGVSAIIERGNIDKDRQLINSGNGRSFTSAYKALFPNKPIPESLRKSDKRLASTPQSPPANAPESLQKDDEHLTAPANAVGKPPTKSEPSKQGTGAALSKTTAMPSQPSTALRGNWTDWWADEQWFLQSFCNTGQYRWCPANLNGWAYSGPRGDNTTWFQATGFAQGFNSTAHFYVMYKSCNWSGWSCSWKIPSNGNYTLQPREFVTLTWTTRGSRWAGIESSTDRVALAILWNTAGTPPPSPTPNPGPCNDPGEFCCHGQATATSYCNGNVVCDAGMCVTP